MKIVDIVKLFTEIQKHQSNRVSCLDKIQKFNNIT